ncbi:Surface-associated antigen 2 [Trichostrongylus colubriformis]|uniref:Surface-associated antigen 2 n=1 Tax=Trichostrongylus colubriformis TaxID=6319 RepID=A0AAN8IN76_TRICO
MLKLVVLACVLAVSFAQGPQGPPPFLQNAPPAKQKEFEGLLANAGGMTDAQIDQKVQQWVSQQDAGIQGAFKDFVQQVKTAQAQSEAAHQAAVAKFGPEAKAADAKLSAIAADPAKTNQQKAEEISNVLSSLPQAVRNEIETAMKG